MRRSSAGSATPRLLVTVAGYGLRGDAEFHPSPLSQPEWERFLEAVAQQRLIGLLVNAIRDGAFPITGEQGAEAISRWRGEMTWTLLLEHSLLEVVSLLNRHQIAYRVLKGPSFAHTVYRDPSMRPFEDIDLLVPSDRFDDAVSVLTKNGGVRSNPEPRAGFLRRFGKSAAIARPNNTYVDLHRTLTPGPYGLTIELESLFETSTPFSIAGRTLLGLGPEEAFLHACYHAALGNHPLRLLPLRDVVQTLQDPRFDLERAQQLWTSWKACAVVASAIQTAWETLELESESPLIAWARAYDPTWSDKRLISLFRGPEEHDEMRATVAMVRSIEGWSAKAAYLRAQLLPSQTYLEVRGETYWSHWWRGAQLFLRPGRRRERAGRRRNRRSRTST